LPPYVSIRELDVVLCPIALAVGCKKCPMFAVCPVKGLIGDYGKARKASDSPARATAGKSKGAAKRKSR
jgi:hypothetical protein